MAKQQRFDHPETGLIQHRHHDEPFGSPVFPVYGTTTYRFDSTSDLLDVVEGRRDGALYTRYGHNPTVTELEHQLAPLEQADAALAFGSGMAAISATLLAHGRQGVVCLGDLYGGTQEFLAVQCRSLGLPVQFLLQSEQDQLADCLDQPGMLVFCETPSNPTLSILDLDAIARTAHERQALLAVDNTFASPINQQPLTLGADLALHSATKYLGGHSDLTAGALMGASEYLEPVAAWRKNLGQALAPEVAALLSRSLKTLPLRVRQHNANAQAVADALMGDERLSRVLYPGLPTDPGHGLASRQMSGFGGMVTLEVAAGGPAASRIADQLALFMLAPSLGGVESLVTQPCTTSHHGLTPEQRAERGITDGMLRLSVGLEHADDLIADLRQALRAA